MKKYIVVSVLFVAILGLSLGVVSLVRADADNRPELPVQALERHTPVCPPGPGNEIRCHARVVVDVQGNPRVSTSAVGFGPAELHNAYTSQTLASGRPIIGIVDAYDDPNIVKDLKTYSSAFGIPVLPTCVGPIAASAVPCFQKIDQLGGANYPAVNSGWALEIALDVEVAHAICQNCSLLLVEAQSNGYPDMLTAFDRAITAGATVVSNSYGSDEFSSETGYDGHFNRTGVAITFSSGDGGYRAQYPAASPYVTAVGGTSLTLKPDRTYQGELAWGGAGSGCSGYETKPSWQTDPLCAKRTIADVSAVADPNTGAAIYNSIANRGKQGWFRLGGTSLAAPLVAGVYALAGNVPSGVYGNSLPYAHTANLHDIVSGSNGSCGGTYLCTATSTYDGPTGLGTPNGLIAF